MMGNVLVVNSAGKKHRQKFNKYCVKLARINIVKGLSAMLQSADVINDHLESYL